jgi:hypothetical protein
MFQPYFQNTTIWRLLSPLNFSSVQSNFSKKLCKIKICIPLREQNIAKYSLSFSDGKKIRKKGRRKLKPGQDYELALHTKDNDDNIKRKVKTHFHNFIVAYLNMIIKQTLRTKRLYKFKKMCSKITQDVTISYNKKLMDTPVKDILVQVSNKFKDKDINLYYIEKIFQMKSNNLFENDSINTLQQLLNTSYKDMMNNFYLKSTKKVFENEKIDESFEKHIENLTIKYGYNYAIKFKQNAENFVNFYISSKQRNHKGNKEDIVDEKNEKDKNLNCLNMNLEKKFFEIIRDNNTSSIGTPTRSQSDSCDGSSEREENEKIDKEKCFLNKKRKSIFNVLPSSDEKNK